MEWKNWKSITSNLKYDSHRAETVDIETGRVVHDTSLSSMWDDMLDDELRQNRRRANFYKGRVIRRVDVGDAFCTTDWSKY